VYGRTLSEPHQRRSGNYEKALEFDSTELTAWFNRGIDLIGLKNYIGAIQNFEKVIELEPENIRAWEEIYSALRKLENYDEAIDCYIRVLKLDPKNKQIKGIIEEIKY